MSYIVFPSPLPAEKIGQERLPATADLEIWQGDRFEFVVAISDENDLPVSQAGNTPIAAIVETFDSVVRFNFVCSVSYNEVTLVLSSQTSATIPAGDYIWEFQMTDSGNQTRTYIVGNVNVYRAVVI